jgi:microsomal epoxide hydrolase
MSSTKPYGALPATANGTFEPFEIHVEDRKLHDFTELLRLSPVAQPCFENQDARLPEGRNFGVSREWLLNAKKEWLSTFDWRKEEAHLNSFPQYRTSITDDDGRTHSLHFAALFSKKEGAVPIVRSHGWPCTFAEFFPVLELLQAKYTPESLPYHFIMPSLPGYVFSSPPPLDRDWTMADSARLTHKLMVQLGFGAGYMVQGGDIGSAVSRTIAATYPECKIMHLNYCQMGEPEDTKGTEFTDAEKKGLERYEQFNVFGTAYGRMHGTRPSTIGHVLASSPLALLSWIAEKYLAWSDPSFPIPLSTILREVSLYWFTECFATSIYPYREDFGRGQKAKGYFHGQEELYVDKPFGYSSFPFELGVMPRKWVETTGRLVWCRVHERGGHFPALERPEVLLGDLEEFVGEAW